MASFGLDPSEEVVSVTIRYNTMNEEVIQTSVGKLDALKASTDRTAASTDRLTQSGARQDITFRALSSTFILANSALNRMGVLSDSTANSLNTLIGVVQLLRVAQTAYTAAVSAETTAQWSNAVARAAAWVAANPLFLPLMLASIGAVVAGVAALKVSGALAEGGTTTMPGRYLVGERGAELLELPAAATVTPLGGGAGGGNIYHITLIGDPRSWDRELRGLLE